MDADRFDESVRSLHRIARRGALGGVFGAGLAALLGLPGAGETEAKKRNASPVPPAAAAAAINSAAMASAPIAVTGGETFCDGVCFDLAADGAHCGACDTACVSEICINGACACPEGTEQCPTGCGCFVRPEGEPVCASGFGSGAPCTTEADCPLGSVCIEVGGGVLICSDPCLARGLPGAAGCPSLSGGRSHHGR